MEVGKGMEGVEMGKLVVGVRESSLVWVGG